LTSPVSAGDVVAVASGEALLGEVLIDAGQTLEAVEVLEAAVARQGETGGEEVRGALLGNLSRAYMRAGRSADAVATADRALTLAERLHLDQIIAETLNNKGSSLSHLGRQVEGTALTGRCRGSGARAGLRARQRSVRCRISRHRQTTWLARTSH